MAWVCPYKPLSSKTYNAEQWVRRRSTRCLHSRTAGEAVARCEDTGASLTPGPGDHHSSARCIEKERTGAVESRNPRGGRGLLTWGSEWVGQDSDTPPRGSTRQGKWTHTHTTYHFLSFHWIASVCFILFYFFLFEDAPVAYGSSQARGWIRATAVGLQQPQQYSTQGSKPHLQPTPQLAATLDP